MLGKLILIKTKIRFSEQDAEIIILIRVLIMNRYECLIVSAI
jgi:hypothetical protein